MCPTKILAVGLEAYDAGKTTLCKALIHGFKEIGVKLVPFKPHSGISYWNQFDTFKRNFNKTALVCSDIMQLEEAAHSRLPLEILNPVNRLVGPVLNGNILEENLAAQAFVAQRFTHYDGAAPRNTYYLNESAKNMQLHHMEEYFSKIKERADETRFINSFEDIVAAYDNSFNNATVSCYNRVRDQPLVVESFNDAAYPFNGAEDCDVVLCISSCFLLQLDKCKYFEAIDLYRRRKSKLQLTTSEVYSPSQIRNRFLIQALGAQERNDCTKLIQSYSKVIEQLQTQSSSLQFS